MRTEEEIRAKISELKSACAYVMNNEGLKRDIRMLEWVLESEVKDVN